ncbi:hypothetical protein [Pseudomonas extremaustralis]|jgi:hypothetical protein|uniref:hypothetical protein n=1 Tax=Pseudomonas extremaustralis TaxID=359110 RepID=UPI002AA77975|nr:hypothetical protein [Pseudomonas extremaustralis]
MSTKSKAHSCKEIADEAVFHLECGKEFATWMAALMAAIRDDHKHSDGSNSAGLAELGVYLADAHLADVEHSVDDLNENLSSLGGSQ